MNVLVDDQEPGGEVLAPAQPRRRKYRVGPQFGEQLVEAKVLTEKPCSTALMPRLRQVRLADPGGPWIRTVSAPRTQAQVASVSMRERSIAGWKAKSKFTRVCPVGRLGA